MKILFVCSCLEPGLDGVGDYTRRLAAGLVKQGVATAIVSINDRYIDKISAITQQSDGVTIPVMRVPASFFHQKKYLKEVRQYVDQFDPDWISLQFVPFGFHAKGLSTGLSKALLAMSAGRAWHIMFHELWVGMAKEESQKLIWWGRLQRLLIKSLIKTLQPKVIHTQTMLYRSLLNQMGFKAGYLPLFGNIPIDSYVTSKDKLKADGNIIEMVVFGLIHDGAPIETLAMDAAHYSTQKNKAVKLTFIGRCDSEQGRWAAAWRAAGLPVTILGEQPAERISSVLSNATMGISATATAVIDKSGTVAAMREHGLSVLSVSKPWQPRGIIGYNHPAGVIPYKPGNFEECINSGKISLPVINQVTTVALRFIKDLSNIN
ncbi:MAG: glycosyltransferase [Mucilaginibacter sp.]